MPLLKLRFRLHLRNTRDIIELHRGTKHHLAVAVLYTSAVFVEVPYSLSSLWYCMRILKTSSYLICLDLLQPGNTMTKRSQPQSPISNGTGLLFIQLQTDLMGPSRFHRIENRDPRCFHSGNTMQNHHQLLILAQNLTNHQV